MTTISVIIVNWNGKQLLAECLDTLRLQTHLPDEILVVDNGSSDGSQDLLRASYPEITLIELPENKGFSIANNIGIRRAKGEYVALLNNDIVLDRGWMGHMAAALESDTSLGSCACKMLFYDRPDIIDSAGVMLRTNGTGRNRGLYERDGEPFDRPAQVFGACAGAAMYRATMLQDIGLFDEDLYIYFEDVDLSFRAQLAGYNCLYVPQAVAYHHHAASSNRFSKKYHYLTRNSLLVIAKDMPWPLVRRYLPLIVAVPLSYAVQGGMMGHGGAFAVACLDALRLLPRMLHKRQVIQRRARRNADEITALLS